MLGGSVYIAFVRFAISLAGVILLFSLMSESRFGRKKTVICYNVIKLNFYGKNSRPFWQKRARVFIYIESYLNRISYVIYKLI